MRSFVLLLVAASCKSSDRLTSAQPALLKLSVTEVILQLQLVADIPSQQRLGCRPYFAKYHKYTASAEQTQLWLTPHLLALLLPSFLGALLQLGLLGSCSSLLLL